MYSPPPSPIIRIRTIVRKQFNRSKVSNVCILDSTLQSFTWILLNESSDKNYISEVIKNMIINCNLTMYYYLDRNIDIQLKMVSIVVKREIDSRIHIFEYSSNNYINKKRKQDLNKDVILTANLLFIFHSEMVFMV